MLPARFRMRRSVDFDATIRHGRRAVQPDIVLHVRRVEASGGSDAPPGPRIGLIVAKSVGTAVQRHRVARRLRHAVLGVLDEIQPCDQLVIRALPGSSQAPSARLTQQLQAGWERLSRGRTR